MVLPDDLAMSEGILAELRRLDLTYVSTCHLVDVDVSFFLSSLWDNIPLPSSSNWKPSLYRNRLSGAGSPLGRANTAFCRGKTYACSESLVEHGMPLAGVHSTSVRSSFGYKTSLFSFELIYCPFAQGGRHRCAKYITRLYIIL